ncbi:hypothetical protein BBJ28_00005222 [Nothophytophthora sp. Chile5]|nr:hypothetical protein BBJ28_00005222 [Nothophytophthora sp. Chile5]
MLTLALACCLPIVATSTVALPEEAAALSSSFRQLRAETNFDAAPPVFCLDVGLEIAFPSHDVELAMGGATASAAGKSCLRSSLMGAVLRHLKEELRSFSLHAVDCVLEPVDLESSTIALLGITSVCSRSNMEIEEDLAGWGHDAKRQIDALFETEKRIAFEQTTGMVRRVPLSPAYALPSSGSGLPQLILGETQIWSDAGDEEEDANAEPTEAQSFFTHVKLGVRNGGAIPLHLYRLTIVEQIEGHAATTDRVPSFVLPLVTPAVVQPGTSSVVKFKAITSASVDSAKSYLLYVSHSGFRAHTFTGILDDRRFLSREEAVQQQANGDEYGAFDRFALDSASAESLFASFPYAPWRVGSVAVVVVVGLVVTFYMRRKLPGLRPVTRGITNCLRSRAGKTKNAIPSKTTATARRSVKSPSARSLAAIANKGGDHIEMQSLIQKPLSTQPSSNGGVSEKLKTTAPRAKMPAITMKWKAPPPAAAPPAERASLPALKTMAKPRWHLNLDRAAKLHPKRFESMWDEYVERYVSTDRPELLAACLKRVHVLPFPNNYTTHACSRFQADLPEACKPEAAKLLQQMETQGISCMASGTVNGVDKFVFYGKQRERAWFFLVTVDVTVSTAKVALTVRTSSDAAEELVQELVKLVQATIVQSAAS